MGGLSVKLASRNEHKLRELAELLQGWQLEPLEVASYPPETAATYYGNARAKAEHGRAFAGEAPVLGEDSGIEVEGLGGRPGVVSARFGGADSVGNLLAELEKVAGPGRRARYVCELVYLGPGGDELRGTGILEGRIAEEPSGSEGFGYDPIFVPAGEERTVAELGNGWKREHSHRARAAREVLRALAERR
ncbi:MAG TPA: non-canonical purine NTP pyrophosphatase [Gaiellaceae bacterium]